MRFMQIDSVLQTKNRSEPAKNRFSVTLPTLVNASSDGMVRQKLGVGKWKKNRGFDIPKSS